MKKRFGSRRLSLNKELYKKLYLIRRAEEGIRKYYAEDDMKTPMHMSMGEEACVAGACHALGKDGQALGTYRSHALYLAMAGETDKFFAEMYGKRTGVAKGRAGSMHLASRENGFLGSSAVVASSIPVASGVAFANKFKKSKRIVGVFFGDGAIDEGNFWETLNIACLMRLPVIFFCEDNNFAVHTPPVMRHGYKSIVNIVKQFECNVFETETTDVEEIHDLTKRAIAAIKKNGRPSFVYARYYRYLEHVGVYEDFEAGYRSRKEFERWLAKDPVKIQREKLATMGVGGGEIAALEKEIDRKVERSVEMAKKSPFPEIGETYTDVFA